MSTVVEPGWGPTGRTVYERTYRRTKANGDPETWLETVTRVVDGNLGLVDARFIEDGERDRLIELMHEFEILPAGRHLWASGVPGRQFLFNCHVSGWGEKFSDHFDFQLMRSAEGGGVGANYSSRYLKKFGPVLRALNVHIVCDSEHQDYQAMVDSGLLSTEYSSDWSGAWEVGDSREGWSAAMCDLIDTYFREDVSHPDRVYDVSNVRPEGSRLKTFGGTASGPLPFARMLHRISEILNNSRWRTWKNPVSPQHVSPLEAMAIDHALGECVLAGGVRRTARMSILHWKDPQIFEFIRCKTDTGDHWTTNISVEIDEEFLEYISIKDDRDLPNNGHIRMWNQANSVLIEISEGMYLNGEPGIWNSYYSNKDEPNPVVCTNPCGEIALEEWENCNLGHVNLDAFWDDIEGAVDAHRLMARFLIRATYGDVNDPKQAEKLARNRRIGVGHFGYQGWVNKNGIRYSDSWRDERVWEFLSICGDEVRDSADQYAFQLRIPSPVKVTTVAPTGSIAKMPGRTEGIHPVYAKWFNRRVRFNSTNPNDANQVLELLEQGYRMEIDQYDKTGNTVIIVMPTKELLVQEVEALGLNTDIVESSDQISLEDMLGVQAMYQTHYADNAVSYTAQVIPEASSPEAIRTALTKYLPLLKGTTIFPDLSRPQAPYERITEEQYLAASARAVGDGTDEDCANGACPVR